MENKVKCTNCPDGFFRKVSFEGVQYDQCNVCGMSGFPQASLARKFSLQFTPVSETKIVKCPACQNLLKTVKTPFLKNPVTVCNGCAILWAKSAEAEAITTGLQEAEAPPKEKKTIPWKVILSVLVVSIGGLWALYSFAYWVSDGAKTESILIAFCVGLPTLYLLNLAIHGAAPNMDQNSDGTMHSDIEHLGTVMSQVWQEIRVWVFVTLALLIGGIYVLFTFSLPKAQLYRFIGWSQKPYRNYLDAVNSKDKEALARMCDWYRKAQTTNPRVFDTMENSHVDTICRSAGK